MMGQLSSGQERLFYSFNLDDHIPANHLLRSIDQCLDLSELRHYLADFYSPIGRPSIDPELMIRMLIVGYCYGIRSERRLCEEAHLNLAYRWFCRLSLEDEIPNHSTFSKNRHGRFRDSELFRWLFNQVLRRCMDAGLVKGEGFAVDASIIKADASRQRGVPGDEQVNWSDPALSTRAVREYLEALDEEALAETLPKRLSLTDPQARWTAASGGPAFYAYSTNYLIHAAAGGVGSMAVQIAKYLGAEVYATASAHNHAYLKDLGADYTIDYRTQAFDELVAGVDVVLDLVGGETQNRSFKVLKRNGVLVSPVSLPNMSLANDYGVTPANFATRSDGRQLSLIAELFDKGHLRVDVEAYPLSEAKVAIEKSMGRHLRGRLVLDTTR